MRAFIRHPSDIPIEVQLENDSPSERRTLKDLGLGGVCFSTPAAMVLGSHVLISVPLIDPAFCARFRVVWCKAHGDGFDVGAQIVNHEDVFRTRMVQQACHIEQYKRDTLSGQGRRLSGEQAALEWIEKHAADFPSID